ncbi:conjugative transposon protein TraM [Formosa algae]|uniref:conjugative transposon protein TraM n=1 Tax=Formosa algae TaxID=225843 RepID=UPI000CCE44F0|nr:conjugative transposon protein TraM [Formosa algae]PNW27276.1 conjugal transfer protein TraM [Formosa algae]
MKLEKNKIVFGGFVLCVLLFIGAYGIILMDENEEPVLNVNQIPIPDLEDDQIQYDSKLEAINDLKDEKQTNAPSIYDERYLDSLGVYDSHLIDSRKLELVDSIYEHSKIFYTDEPELEPLENYKNLMLVSENPPLDLKEPLVEHDTKAMGLQHQLFFASNPQGIILEENQKSIPVVVDGKQTIRTNSRIRMRLLEDSEINGNVYPKHTAVYGFVAFKPNRTLIKINKIDHDPVKLSAYDWQDGNEGIYIKNSFRAEATTEVIGDLVQDINIAGVPQIEGVKHIFQRDNRSVKVTVLSNYKMFLRVD